MSWSFSAIGRPVAVLEKARKDIAGSSYKCPEPEQAAKLKVVEVLETLLPSYPANAAVQVTASGSQHAPDHTQPTEVVNSFAIDIKPLYGFVE